jgi:hypothetical protein
MGWVSDEVRLGTARHSSPRNAQQQQLRRTGKQMNGANAATAGGGTNLLAYPSPTRLLPALLYHEIISRTVRCPSVRITQLTDGLHTGGLGFKT